MLFILQVSILSEQIRFKDSTRVIDSMRNLEDIKGGGLMILHKKNSYFRLEKKASSHIDILIL